MNPVLSKKFRFYSFISMVLLVFVHGYNLHQRYLQPWSVVEEPLNFTTFTEYFIANGLVRFRIPMLFAISGYLFAMHDEQAYGKRIRKRLRTLMLPYLLWSIIGLLIAVLLYHLPATKEAVINSHLQPINKTFDSYTVSDWLLAILWPTSFQLWFLRSLFMYNLLYPWLLKGVMQIPKVLFTVFVILWIGTFGFIILEGEGLLFFSLGIWLCKRQKNIEEVPRWLNLPLFTFLFIAICASKTWLAFKAPGLGSFIYPLLSVLHKVVIGLGLLVVWFGCNSLVTFFMNKKWFIHLSAFAFIIYALHVPLVTYLIDPVFNLMRGFLYYRMVTFIFLPLLIIAFCILVGAILRKVVPKTYGVLTGGRGF
jgi:fucose 4-O-acetylase-like acetyltransferase